MNAKISQRLQKNERTQNEFYIEFHNTIKLTIAWEEKQN